MSRRLLRTLGAAGFVAFASPCLLPLVPGYLGYLGGMSGATLAGARRRGSERSADPASTDGSSRAAGAGRSSTDVGRTRLLAGVGLFVATDQEGGQVRVLQGRGFSDIPSALVQGTWEPRRLRGAAEVWARQLRRAGVNLDLAPVMDTSEPSQ